MAKYLLGLLCILYSSFSFCEPSQSEKFQEILKSYTEKVKRLDPFYAAIFNVEEDLEKFGDYPTPQFFKRALELRQQTQKELEKIKYEALSVKEQVSYLLLKDDVEVTLESFQFPNEYLEFNQLNNRMYAYLNDTNQSLTTFPFDSAKHYKDFVKRSQGFPEYVDNQIAFFRKGIKSNIVLNCKAAEQVPNTYEEALLAENGALEKHPFWRPILFMPPEIRSKDQEEIKKEFREMIQKRIIPGYRKFADFYKKEYIPHCRKNFGLLGYPNAKNWYSAQIRASTNLTLSAKEIHQLGLKEVKELRKRLEVVQKSLGFKGTIKDFLKFNSENPKYFFKTPEEVMEAFKQVKTKVDVLIPNYFSLTPKTEFKIVESSNPEDAAASYNQPRELMPYGRFVVNTKNIRSIPLFEVNTLFLHEAIPGHHFQLALQFEKKDELSEFQRNIFNSNSFVEGWALYCESLGYEFGLYQDPLQEFGHLNDQMLRTVRLVVDTGIHAFGWSQKKVIKYMSENLAADPKDIINEANRYSVWPGQALGYKLGQIKIMELKELAKTKLGKKFDIKDFHRVVLENGTVSLGVLETQVKNWISK